MPAFASNGSLPNYDNKRLNLVVVCPGKSKRAPILQKISKVARVIIVVPQFEGSQGFASWAKTLVGKKDWVEVDGNYDETMVEHAVRELIDFIEKDPMKNYIHGIMTYDDYAVLMTANIREKLNQTIWYDSFKLPGTPSETIAQLQNKKVFRDICEERLADTAKIPSLKICADKDTGMMNVDSIIESVGSSWNHWPAVLKPIMGSGKAATEKVDDVEMLIKPLSEIQESLQNLPPYRRDAGFVLEKYFGGLEVDIDGFARNGKVQFHYVNYNEPGNEDEHFLEQGGIYPFYFDPRDEKLKIFEHNRENIIQKLHSVTEQILNTFVGYHGVFHFEAKIDPVTLEVMVLEFNPRVGGGPCPEGVQTTTGYCLPEVAACLALNLPVKKGEKVHEVVVYGHLYPKGKNVDARLLFEKKSEYKVVEFICCNYFGWLTTGGKTVEEAYANLEKGMQLITLEE